ncbi:hypothetical protein IFM5058_06623 [Aspergillus udagawae]|nr:hypothetical protein IFM5058_06623 [Aspergillus udagawae]
MTVLKFKRGQSEWGYHMEKFLRLEILLSWINDECDKLIILEDPTPNMIAEIGGRLNIDPQFWADFLVGPSWFGSGKLYIGAGEPRIPYRDDSLLEQLWPLPSAAQELQHASFRFVAHRERKFYGDSNRDLKDRRPLSKMYPIAQEARPGPPGSGQSVRVRSNLTIWRNWKSRQRAEDENQEITEPWIGVIAIQNQSSRVPVSKQGYSYIFRNILRRPQPHEKINMDILRLTEEWEGRSQREPKYNQSIKDIYCHILKTKFKNKADFDEVTKSPNTLFVDLLRLKLPDFVKYMKRDPSGKGFTHLGKDGVLRTISGDYEVVDARGLDPEQIKNILDVMPFDQAQKEDFYGVDGTKVTSQEALFHPAPGILPTRPSEGCGETETCEPESGGLCAGEEERS